MNADETWQKACRIVGAWVCNTSGEKLCVGPTHLPLTPAHDNPAAAMKMLEWTAEEIDVPVLDEDSGETYQCPERRYQLELWFDGALWNARLGHWQETQRNPTWYMALAAAVVAAPFVILEHMTRAGVVQTRRRIARIVIRAKRSLSGSRLLFGGIGGVFCSGQSPHQNIESKSGWNRQRESNDVQPDSDSELSFLKAFLIAVPMIILGIFWNVQGLKRGPTGLMVLGWFVALAGGFLFLFFLVPI